MVLTMMIGSAITMAAMTNDQILHFRTLRLHIMQPKSTYLVFFTSGGPKSQLLCVSFNCWCCWWWSISRFDCWRWYREALSQSSLVPLFLWWSSSSALFPVLLLSSNEPPQWFPVCIFSFLPNDQMIFLELQKMGLESVHSIMHAWWWYRASKKNGFSSVSVY